MRRRTSPRNVPYTDVNIGIRRKDQEDEDLRPATLFSIDREEKN